MEPQLSEEQKQDEPDPRRLGSADAHTQMFLLLQLSFVFVLHK